MRIVDLLNKDSILLNGAPKSKTEAIEEGTVNRDFARVKKALNIRTAFTTHTMRKTFAHYAAPVISKLRLEGIVFIDPHTLDIIRGTIVGSCFSA